MSAMDDTTTLGRGRPSFALRPISTSSPTRWQVRERRDRARPVARVPAGARHVRPAPGGRRPDAAREDPAGRAHRTAGSRARRRRRAVLPGLRAHHDAAEHPAALPEAARRRARDAPPRRRGPDDARGLRQLGAQHHRLPVGGRRRRRAVRRHAVRRSADALLPAAQAQRVAAAQVQDRLRGLRRGSRAHGDSRHRLARGRPGRGRQAGAWLPRGRRRRHRDDVPCRPRRCTSSCRSPTCSRRRKRSCACSTSLATTSTSTRTG